MYPSASRSAVLGLCLLAGACAIEMDLPEPFLQLDTPGSWLKATTPDDARLWVREFADPDQGSVQFWSEALKNDLTRNRGYALVETGEARDQEGREGVRMEFRTTTQGERVGYLVAVFVLPGSSSNTIRVLEFTAREAVFASHVDAVVVAIGSLRP